MSIRPIDMQIIAKNVDEVSKASKVKEQNAVHQQENAAAEEKKEIDRSQKTVTDMDEIEKKDVDKDGKGKKEASEHESQHKEDEDHEKHKSKDPRLGNIVDLEG